MKAARHQTWPKMPPFGVAEAIMGPHADGGDLFRLWLVSHDDHVIGGATFWRAAVLREVLPSPTDDLVFEAAGELLGPSSRKEQADGR